MFKNNYSNTINDYILKLQESIKYNLEMIYIIGSSASDNVVVGWSDIDCIIVLSYYDINDIELIKAISNSYHIKIGNTIYSKKEFENKWLDQKTLYYLYLNQERVLSVDFQSKELKIPKIDVEEVKNSTKIMLFNDLHNCKRLLTYLELSNVQIKTLFKKIYVIMKSILILNDYKPKNYKETFTLFHEVFSYEYFDYLKFIDDYKKNQVNVKYLKKYAFQLIDYIINNILL